MDGWYGFWNGFFLAWRFEVDSEGMIEAHRRGSCLEAKKVSVSYHI